MSFTQKKKRKEKTSELDANGKTFLVVENNAALYLFFYCILSDCSHAGSSQVQISPASSWFTSKSSKKVSFVNASFYLISLLNFFPAFGLSIKYSSIRTVSVAQHVTFFQPYLEVFWSCYRLHDTGLLFRPFSNYSFHWPSWYHIRILYWCWWSCYFYVWYNSLSSEYVVCVNKEMGKICE